MIAPLIISLIPPIIFALLAVYLLVYGLQDRSIVIIFLLLCILIFYASIQVIIQAQTDIENIRYLARIRTSCWGFIIPLSFHTIYALFKMKGRQWRFILAGFYIFGIGLISISFLGNSILWIDVDSWFGKNVILTPGKWFFWLFNAFLLLCIGAFCLALLRTRIETDNYRQQKLSKSILTIFVWTGTITVMSIYVFTVLKFPIEELLPYLGGVKMLAILFVIQKYQPEKILSQNLFSSLSPLLPFDTVLISPDEKIQWINKNKLTFTGFTIKEVIGKSYEILFANPELIYKEIKEINNSSQYSASLETECNTSKGNFQRLCVNIIGLRNEFGDITAYLFTFSLLAEQMPLLELLQKTYNLSNREKEVAALLIEGRRYSEISDKLFISLNTIKTHTRNIYLKTNTSSQQELQRLCREIQK